jgi:hypothetical protein
MPGKNKISLQKKVYSFFSNSNGIHSNHENFNLMKIDFISNMILRKVSHNMFLLLFKICKKWNTFDSKYN